MPINLLLNPSFGLRHLDGSFDSAPPGVSGLLPIYWLMPWYANGPEPKIDKLYAEWGIPEILPIQYIYQFPERDLLYDDPKVDDYILHLFCRSRPCWATVIQNVKLRAGKHRLRIPVYPDAWHKTDNGLVRPSPQTSDDWYLGSEVMLLVMTDTGTLSTPWMDARKVPFGNYTPLVFEFETGDEVVGVGFSLRGRWGFQHNGWFVDGCSLEDVEIASDYNPGRVEDTPSRLWLKMAMFGVEQASKLDEEQARTVLHIKELLQRMI